MQAEKMLMLFEPELETKRLLSSAVGQVLVAVDEVIPAQREKARPVGLVPAGEVLIKLRAPVATS
jgi:hypothetical protein